MSDDLRLQIVRALHDDLCDCDQDVNPHDDGGLFSLADAILAVVQPVIDRLERERGDERADAWGWAFRATAAEKRIATLEAALREARGITSKDYIGVGRAGLVVQMGVADDILAAALGEQEG